MRTVANPLFTGSAPSPAARGEHPQDVTGLQPERALVGQPLGSRLVAARQQPVLAGGAGLAAGQAPRLRHPALGDQRDGNVLQHLQVALDPLTPGCPARAAAPSPQPVAQHTHRVGPLQRLGRGVPRVRQLSTL